MSARWAGMMALLLGACVADPGWERRVLAIEASLERAEAAGAMRCAPRELALGRAHLGFARFERERGQDARAREHLAIAEPNAGAAELLSPAPRCADVATESGPGPLEPSPGDETGALPDGAEPSTGDDSLPLIEGPGADTAGLPHDPPVEPPLDPQPEVDVARDSDGDGVRDALDECPLVAGEAGAACPQSYEGLVVRAHRVVLLRPIVLDAQGTPSVETRELLAALARALRDRPAMRVEVGAHTDSAGGELENLAESQRRAERVRALLVELGVEPERVRARGYGDELPLESNSTPEGRAANRRIEILRIEAGHGTL